MWIDNNNNNNNIYTYINQDFFSNALKSLIKISKFLFVQQIVYISIFLSLFNRKIQ